MRILIDLGHPAHVHLFRHAIGEWRERGHAVVLVARDKDIVTDLMDAFGWAYTIGSRARTSRVGLFLELIEHDWRVLSVAKRHRVDVMLGTSVAIAHASRLLSAKSVVFNEDDRSAVRLFALLAYPFADCIVTPQCLGEDHGLKHVTYDSYHELAYLHPSRFSCTREDLERIGLADEEPYFIVRLVSLEASHDFGERGIDDHALSELVPALAAKGRVLITTERELPQQYEQFRFPIAPEDMHVALNFASLFVGDSQTMAAEAAVLGVPSLRLNSFVGRISYLEELEHRYGLTFGYRPGEERSMVNRAIALLDSPDLRNKWHEKRMRMLNEKVELTSWMVDFVEQFSQEGYRRRG